MRNTIFLVFDSDSCPLILTLNFQGCRKLCIHLKIRPCMFIPNILSFTYPFHVQSQAFSRSQKIAIRCCFFFQEIRVVVLKSTKVLVISFSSVRSLLLCFIKGIWIFFVSYSIYCLPNVRQWCIFIYLVYEFLPFLLLFFVLWLLFS